MQRPKLIGDGVIACAAVLVVSSAATAATAPVLDVYGVSLTSYKATAATPVQNLRPRFDQRGVDIDGTLRSPSPYGWAVAADPLGGGMSSGRTLGDVNLFTGTYNPTEVDLSFPTIGAPVVIGRTYSHVSLNSGGSQFDCGGVVGTNWAVFTQPEVVLFEGATDDLDVLYLVYGADRYIEFKREDDEGAGWFTFKAKNGAAGVITYEEAPDETEPDLYTYYDQRGTRTVFFGHHTNAGAAKGQLWKIIDRADEVAYVGDKDTASTAISGGYSGTGRIEELYDATGRRYTFSYGTVGGVADLLTTAVVEISSGSWAEIGRVAYDYYTSTDPTNDKGLAGDLKTVTITHKGVSGGDYVRTKYYRYYTRAWADSDGRRGEAHRLKMVVGFDGVRQYGGSYDSASESALKPYAESFFEYASGDPRIWKVTFNGNCGCAGGASGQFVLTYADSANTPNYAAQIGDTSYNTTWAKRTIIDQPDSAWITQYFDETGAVLGRAITDGNPGVSYSNLWLTDVVRDSAGCVATVHAPDNIDTYNASNGAVTHEPSAGLVTKYVRQTGTTNLDGLCIKREVMEGTGGTPATIWQISLTDRQLSVGTSGVSVPVVATSTNPADSSVTTYTHTWWDNSTATNVLYIAPKVIQTAAPAVTSNGSGSSVSTYRYLRHDGSTAYSRDGGEILFYTGRNSAGQTSKQIADYNPSTGGYETGDAHSNWSLSAGGSGTPIHAVTEMLYDAQGRPTGTILPSPAAGGTRRTANVYVLDGGQLGTMSFPRVTVSGSTTYYGPATYTRINHAGRTDRRGLVPVSSTVPSATPDSGWSNWVDTEYDLSGMRAAQTKVYTAWSGSPSSDKTLIGYDAMGRVARTEDPTGTITRTTYDARGMVSERWVGLNDNGWTDPAGSGSGPATMVKVETLAYHANGWLTDRKQDADGNWGVTTDQRHTQTQYDYRGRPVVRINPVPPHSVSKYDDLNRVVATGLFTASGGLSPSTDPATTTTARVGLSEQAYDQRGQVWRSIRWEVNPSTGAKGGGIYTHTWYDASMRPVKVLGSQYTKTIYDRLGRAQDRFVLYGTNDSVYADADDVTGDAVLEQYRTHHDPKSGVVLGQYIFQRLHDDPVSGGTTGALYTGTDMAQVSTGSLAGRAQISAMWHDAWDRLEYAAQYGTNGGSNYTRASSAPSPSDTVLVTQSTYDTLGRVAIATDPAGVEHKTAYDFAGRRSSTVANYTGGSPGGGTNKDKDITVQYTYTNGLVTQVTRKVTSSSGDDQVTTYTYGTTLSDSLIATGHLLRRVVYPEQVTSQPDTDRDVWTSYNALSEPISVTDPAGNVIQSTYDQGGRIVKRQAATIVGGFDNRVIEILTDYNTRGQLEWVRQKNSGGTVLDEIQYEYDGLGNLAVMTQDPDSAIGASGRDPFETLYTYAYYSENTDNRGVYLSETRCPFGSSSSDEIVEFNCDATGRVKTTQTGAYLALGEYMYLGARTVVGFVGPEASNHLFGSGGSSDYSTYMDRFNRPILNSWIGGSGDVDFIHLEATQNRYGQMVEVTDEVLKDEASTPNHIFDYLYQYDALRRGIVRDEGELASGSIGTRSRIEQMPRLGTGRIEVNRVSLDGNTTWTNGPLPSALGGEMEDTRTYNKRNELRSRSVLDKDNPSTPAAVALSYDKNGNLTGDGETREYVYDAFGRMVRITKAGSSGSIVWAEYTYDGLGRRISEQLDTNDSLGSGNGDGEVDGYDDVFYLALDAAGRRVATYRDADTEAKEVFYRHPANVQGPIGGVSAGSLLMRERNDDLYSNPETWATDPGDWQGQRDQYCTDFSGNVIALVEVGGGIVEQYRYSSSGVPYGIPAGDLNGDGRVETGSTEPDYLVWASAKLVYDVRGDLDLDGDVDTDDEAILLSADKNITGRGILSVAGVRTIHGFGQCEVFGEGLHTLWGCGAGSGMVVDAGLSVFLIEYPLLPGGPYRSPTQDELDELRGSRRPPQYIVNCLQDCEQSLRDGNSDLAAYYGCVEYCLTSARPPRHIPWWDPQSPLWDLFPPCLIPGDPRPVHDGLAELICWVTPTNTLACATDNQIALVGYGTSIVCGVGGFLVIEGGVAYCVSVQGWGRLGCYPGRCSWYFRGADNIWRQFVPGPNRIFGRPRGFGEPPFRIPIPLRFPERMSPPGAPGTGPNCIWEAVRQLWRCF